MLTADTGSTMCVMPERRASDGFATEDTDVSCQLSERVSARHNLKHRAASRPHARSERVRTRANACERVRTLGALVRRMEVHHERSAHKES